MMQFVRRQWARVDPYLLLLLGLTTFALAPLAAPGYFYGAHDGRHSVFYLTQFDAAIRDGALWPRWAMHHIQGYGYPTFIIQAPLGFYVGELFMLLGAGPTLAAKLSWVVAFWMSAWGMYLLLCTWLTARPRGAAGGYQGLDPLRLAAVVGGLLYVYAPYHLLDMYVRAALNDTLLLAWFPWALLAFERLIGLGDGPGWPRRLALAILVLAGTLLTHTFGLLSFVPLLVTFVLFRLALEGWRRHHSGQPVWSDLFKRMGLALAGGLGALLLFANFLLPLLVEGRHLEQQVYLSNTYDYRAHFVQWSQFLSPFWGFGFSDDPAGANDGMSFQIGVTAVLFGVAAVYQLWRQRVVGTRHRAMMLYLLSASVGLTAIMTPLAAPLWVALPTLSIIQFPWRLLALTALTTAALGGLVTANLMTYLGDRALAAGGGVLLSLLVMAAGMPYIGAELQPVEPWREDGRAIFRFEEEHPDMIAYTEWVKEPFTESPMTADYRSEAYTESHGDAGPLTRLAIVRGGGEVLSSYSRGSSYGGEVRLDEAGVVRVHLYYFPGWQVRLDGVPADVRVSDPYGLMELDVPAGTHRIDLRMGSTPVRRIGWIISGAMLLAVAGLLLRRGPVMIRP